MICHIAIPRLPRNEFRQLSEKTNDAREFLRLIGKTHGRVSS
jgi:hypothetical protein